MCKMGLFDIYGLLDSRGRNRKGTREVNNLAKLIRRAQARWFAPQSKLDTSLKGQALMGSHSLVLCKEV
jgi:hypothetical protein